MVGFTLAMDLIDLPAIEAMERLDGIKGEFEAQLKDTSVRLAMKVRR